MRFSITLLLFSKIDYIYLDNLLIVFQAKIVWDAQFLPIYLSSNSNDIRKTDVSLFKSCKKKLLIHLSDQIARKTISKRDVLSKRNSLIYIIIALWLLLLSPAQFFYESLIVNINHTFFIVHLHGILNINHGKIPGLVGLFVLL